MQKTRFEPVSWLLVVVRRLLWLVLISAVGGLAFSWWRDRRGIDPSGPAEWPPLPPAANNTPSDSTNIAPEPADVTSETDLQWVAAADDGSCPPSHPIKANEKSGIFHVPGGRFYERTKAQRCYQSADAAVADGYRQAKN